MQKIGIHSDRNISYVYFRCRSVCACLMFWWFFFLSCVCLIFFRLNKWDNRQNLNCMHFMHWTPFECEINTCSLRFDVECICTGYAPTPKTLKNKIIRCVYLCAHSTQALLLMACLYWASFNSSAASFSVWCARAHAHTYRHCSMYGYVVRWEERKKKLCLFQNIFFFFVVVIPSRRRRGRRCRKLNKCVSRLN